ncbi:MAG: cytochrome c peroxidase [Saprospiraceae bacterium]
MKKTHLVFLLTCSSFFIQCSDANKESATAHQQRVNLDTLSKVFALPLTAKAPKNNPTTPEKVALGKLLYFDPILSGNKEVACATCHHPSNGFAESLDISIGVNGTGFGHKRAFKQPNDIPFVKRNAHTILNTAFNGINTRNEYDPEKAPMFWDLRVESLEQQALEPIKAFEEMRGHAYPVEEALDRVVERLKAIPAYQELFSKAFEEEDPINEVNLGKAIAAYERTLLSNNSRFDQYMRGDQSALSISELEGLKVFIKTGCAKCHNGPMFSDFKMHVLGAPENEKLPAPDSSLHGDFAFRTPSLRNLRFTFPYMHNGSLNSLQRVLEFYEDISGGKERNERVPKTQFDPLIKELKVEFKEIPRIINFLLALNDDQFDKDVPEQVPSGLEVGGKIGLNQ